MKGYKLVAAFLLVVIGLVEVHSQDFPYISFKGNILPNNSIVILRDVGNAQDGSDAIQCHTNLSTCCSEDEGTDRGGWHFPSGLPVGMNGTGSLYMYPRAQRIDLHHSDENTFSPTDIYRCDIPIDSGDNIKMESVYVGLYNIPQHGKESLSVLK